MEHTVDAVQLERLVGQVEPVDAEGPRVRLLLGRVVVVGEAVDRLDVVAVGEQRLREMRPDEAGCAGDDVPHLGTIP
jgi:hypothetical protein